MGSSRAPTPPENVRVVYPDGSEIPLDLCYVGVDEDGMHQWEVVGPVAVPLPALLAGARVLVGRLPARTAIAFGGGHRD